MEKLQAILLIAVLAVWFLISVVFLITTIQNVIYNRRREKREIEHHKLRMQERRT